MNTLMGMVLRNRISGRYWRCCGEIAGFVMMILVEKNRCLGTKQKVLPRFIARIFYRVCENLRMPWEGRLHLVGEPPEMHNCRCHTVQRGKP